MVCPICSSSNPEGRVSCIVCRGSLGPLRAAPERGAADGWLTESLRRTLRFTLAGLLAGIVTVLYFRFLAGAEEAPSWVAMFAVLCGCLAVGTTMGLLGPAMIEELRTTGLRLRLKSWQRRIERGLQTALQLAPREAASADSRARLGAALFLKGERENASRVFEQALAEFPDDPRLLANQAVIQAAQGHFTIALQGLTRAAELGADKDLIDINTVLAVIAIATPQEAVAACRRAWEPARNRPAVLSALAITLADAGYIEEALGRLQGGVEQDPEDPDLLINLGVLRFRQGDLEGAHQNFLAACESEPSPRWAHHNAGLCALLRGQLGQARMLFSAVLKEDAAFPPTVGQCAFFYRASRQPKRGLEELREASSHAPRDFELRHNLCVWLLEDGKPEEAAAESERAVELRPEDHDALVNWSAASYLSRRYNHAFESGRKAVTLYPDSAPARYNLALALCGLERYDEAVERFNWLTERYPSFAAAWNNLGSILLETGRTVDAANYLIRASHLSPNDPYVHSNLALAYYLEGDATAALQALEIAQRHPDCPHLMDIIGHLHADRKHPAEAAAAWAKMVAQEPTNVELLTNLGIANYRDNQIDAAIECFRKVLLLMPRSVVSHNNLALAYAKNKLLNEAYSHIRKVAELQPENPVVHSNVGLIQYFRGETEDAMSHWRETTRLSPAYARRREATRLSTYDDSEMMVFPINRRKRTSWSKPLFAPSRHEPRFSLYPPQFLPLLPWPDLAEIRDLQDKVQVLRRRLNLR